MIVADASLAISLLVGFEPVASRAWKRLEDESRIHAPELFDLEVANSLRGLVRAGKIEAMRARRLLLVPTGLPVRHHRHEPLLERVWELRHNLNAYDAIYVALAEVLRAPLLTEVRAIAEAPGVRCQVELFT